MESPWKTLRDRLRRRFIRTIDVISILGLDAVVLAVGYAVIRVAEALSGSANKFFEAARVVSGGLFLLLYLVLVFFDILEFFRGHQASS